MSRARDVNDRDRIGPDEIDRDEYLWDRSGKPDELITALEARLAPLRHREVVPDWERLLAEEKTTTPSTKQPRRWWRGRRRSPGELGAGDDRLFHEVAAGSPRLRWAAVAAALAIAVAGAAWWRTHASATSWRIERVAGAPRLGDGALRAGERWHSGAVLTTGSRDRARLSLRGVGEVELLPKSQLRLLAAEEGHQLLALDRGAISASIGARPQLFQVATPQTRAVDLGCYFTLEVLPDGRERLRVEAGWVALRRGDREAFVPGGAAVVSAPGQLGLPVYLDARELRAALDRWTALSDGDERSETLRAALALARPEDALTLWHLLAVTQGLQREAVFDRLASIAPPPPTVTRQGIVAGDPAMRDRWWESLGLGTAAWWRGWRVAYPATPSR